MRSQLATQDGPYISVKRKRKAGNTLVFRSKYNNEENPQNLDVE